MRGVALRGIGFLLVPALTIGVAPGAAQMPESRGMIIDGTFETRYAGPCHTQPDCVAWRAAGCPATMAGIDPAWNTAIVAVADRAGTARPFEIRRGAGEGVIFGGVLVQFWRLTCTELFPRWYSHACREPSCHVEHRYIGGWFMGTHRVRTTLSIPRGAAWMTIAANDNLNVEWTLT